jgi:RNA polymerase sigma-70 factor (ECF subfamily)
MEMTFPHRKKRLEQYKQSSSDFDEIFQENWEIVCKVLYRLVGDWEESQDLAIQTFLKLHQHPPDHDSNIKGWLYRVATNKGLNAIRARKRRENYEERAGSLVMRDSLTENPESSLERSLIRDAVRETLSRIKPRSAQLLMLRHSGFSYAEIAETMGIPPGSVGTQLARAGKEFEKKYPLEQ